VVAPILLHECAGGSPEKSGQEKERVLCRELPWELHLPSSCLSLFANKGGSGLTNQRSDWVNLTRSSIPANRAAIGSWGLVTRQRSRDGFSIGLIEIYRVIREGESRDPEIHVDTYVEHRDACNRSDAR